eukprot:1725628-Amphidinium_carterae.2
MSRNACLLYCSLSSCSAGKSDEWIASSTVIYQLSGARFFGAVRLQAQGLAIANGIGHRTALEFGIMVNFINIVCDHHPQSSRCPHAGKDKASSEQNGIPMTAHRCRLVERVVICAQGAHPTPPP